MFFDTDSVIYIHPRGETPGNELGDMISELHPSETIKDFVNGGNRGRARKVCV